MKKQTDTLDKDLSVNTFYSSTDLADFKLDQTTANPCELVQLDDCCFVAFEKAVFGTVALTFSSDKGGEQIRVRLGEARIGNHINRTPGACIRVREADLLQLLPGRHTYRITIPADKRNTGDRAILMPSEVGEVLPFRYVEIEGYKGTLTPLDVTQIMVHYPFNDSAASFTSCSPVLNGVWEMCKHTIKATSFTGIFIDGDRERIPYEGDAYINQLSHYAVDRNYELDRRSHEYLLYKPTWPTEWILHSNLMAWADYMQTGDSSSIAYHYELLQEKSLFRLAREDGLISTKGKIAQKKKKLYKKVKLRENFRDLVDWPPASFTNGNYGENDGYDMEVSYNTVINSFYYKNLLILANMAELLDKNDDAKSYRKMAVYVYNSFNRSFWNKCFGLYCDGEGSDHISLHANMMPLAFGLVPDERKENVINFIKSKGMVCSVYGAQYLLESLYKSGEGQYALGLMEAKHDRSWWNMIAVGSTMALEAWDEKYKNNLDWNHAWGTVPLNIIPRYLFGIKPTKPGFKEILIKPQPGTLAEASLKYPIPQGNIEVSFYISENERVYQVTIPKGVKASFQCGNSVQNIENSQTVKISEKILKL